MVSNVCIWYLFAYLCIYSNTMPSFLNKSYDWKVPEVSRNKMFIWWIFQRHPNTFYITHNSHEQNSFWYADSCSPTQENPLPFMKIHCSILNISPVNPILKPNNPILEESIKFMKKTKPDDFLLLLCKTRNCKKVEINRIAFLIKLIFDLRVKRRGKWPAKRLWRPKKWKSKAMTDTKSERSCRPVEFTWPEKWMCPSSFILEITFLCQVSVRPL